MFSAMLGYIVAKLDVELRPQAEFMVSIIAAVSACSDCKIQRSGRCMRI